MVFITVSDIATYMIILFIIVSYIATDGVYYCLRYCYIHDNIVYYGLPYWYIHDEPVSLLFQVLIHTWWYRLILPQMLLHTWWYCFIIVSDIDTYTMILFHYCFRYCYIHDDIVLLLSQLLCRPAHKSTQWLSSTEYFLRFARGSLYYSNNIDREVYHVSDYWNIENIKKWIHALVAFWHVGYDYMHHVAEEDHRTSGIRRTNILKCIIDNCKHWLLNWSYMSVAARVSSLQ